MVSWFCIVYTLDWYWNQCSLELFWNNLGQSYNKKQSDISLSCNYFSIFGSLCAPALPLLFLARVQLLWPPFGHTKVFFLRLLYILVLFLIATLPLFSPNFLPHCLNRWTLQATANKKFSGFFCENSWLFPTSHKVSFEKIDKTTWESFFCCHCTMYDFHNSSDTLKYWTEKWAINKTFLFFIWSWWNMAKL